MIESIVKAVTGLVGIRGGTTSATIGNEEDRLKTISIVRSSSGNALNVNPDGSLNINLVSTTSSYDLLEVVTNSIQSTTPSTPITILTYTPIPGNTASVQCIKLSSDSLAVLTVRVNGSVVGVKRTFYGEPNIQVDFRGTGGHSLRLSPSDTLTVTVTHIDGNAELNASLELVKNPTINFTNQLTSISNGNATNVPTNQATQVVEYTALQDAFIQRIFGSGENYARWNLKKNNATIHTIRTSYGGSLNIDKNFISFESKGIKLVSGDVVTLEVKHMNSATGSFNASFQVLEMN
jgi:hypothetical protein